MSKDPEDFHLDHIDFKKMNVSPMLYIQEGRSSSGGFS